MINYYSMYTQLLAGTISIFGPSLLLFYPLPTPTTDNDRIGHHEGQPSWHQASFFSNVSRPTNDENFSYVVNFLTGRHYNCKFPEPSSPYALSAFGLYLECAVLPVADNSSCHLAVSLMLIHLFLIPCLLLRSLTSLDRPTSPLTTWLPLHSLWSPLFLPLGILPRV